MKQRMWLPGGQCHSLEAERVTAPEPEKVVTQSWVVTSHPTGGRPVRWQMGCGARLVGDEGEVSDHSCRQGARGYCSVEEHRASQGAVARDKNAFCPGRRPGLTSPPNPFMSHRGLICPQQ